MNRNDYILFCGFVIAAATIKLWLVSAQSICVHAEGTYDDRLFLNIANSILSGKWLGDYNQLTLTKGIFYPLWISFIAYSGLPLLLAQHLLYMVACFIFTFVTKPLIGNTYAAAALFVVLIFNPMTFSVEVMPGLQREGIYPALTILIIAFLIGIGMKIQNSSKIVGIWSISLGLTLAAYWLTREEGVWILPAAIVLISYVLYSVIKNSKKKLLPSAFLFFPFLLLYGGIVTNGLINWMNYNFYVVNELKSPQFRSAYSSLMRVATDSQSEIFPVTQQAREVLYNKSPLFAELQPHFLAVEKSTREAKQYHIENYGTDPDYSVRTDYVIAHLADNDVWKKSALDGSIFDDISGAVFVWVFRDAVAAAGYHESPRRAAAYYQKLADEIDSLCRSGELFCRKKSNLPVPSLSVTHGLFYIQTMVKASAYLLRFDGFSTIMYPSTGTEHSLSLARKLLNEKLFPVQLRITGEISSGSNQHLFFDVLNPDGSRSSHSVTFQSSLSEKGLHVTGNEPLRPLGTRFEIQTRCTINCNLRITDDQGNSLLQPLNRKIIHNAAIGNPNDEIIPVHIDTYAYIHGNSMDVLKLELLQHIGYFYQKAFSLLALPGLLIFFYIISSSICARRFRFYEVVLIVFFTAIISRILVLSLVHVTSFPAISTRYLAPVYPLYIAFVFLALWFPIRYGLFKNRFSETTN